MPVVPFIPAIISGGAAIFGAHEASQGQQQAAETQATASEKAAQAQLQAAQEALNFQKQAYNNRQLAVNPYQNMGLGALSSLGAGLGIKPGSLPAGTVPIANPVGTTVSGVYTPQQRQQILTQNPSLVLPQSAQAAGGSSQPQVGEVRTVNGQQAKWDGQGWEAV
jgi:hypothetical protein